MSGASECISGSPRSTSESLNATLPRSLVVLACVARPMPGLNGLQFVLGDKLIVSKRGHVHWSALPFR